MPAGDYSILYARLCLRLALRRGRSALELLGLAGVESRDRAQWAAPTRAFCGRFDSPGFPVLYAAEDAGTCVAEVAHHLKTHYLRHLGRPRELVFRYDLLEVPLSGRFDDLRRHLTPGLQAPSRLSYPAARQYALAAFQCGLDGLIYDSSRRRGGTCIARFLPAGLVLPVRGIGVRVFTWTGRRLVVQA